MSKLSTLNYLINSYCSGKTELESFQVGLIDFEVVMDRSVVNYEPSQKSIEAVLNFASQYEVLKSVKTGNIELNLN